MANQSLTHGGEKKSLIVRVSLGQIVSNVLCSRMFYVIYPTPLDHEYPMRLQDTKPAQPRDLAQIVRGLFLCAVLFAIGRWQTFRKAFGLQNGKEFPLTEK